ncbi:MAG: bifunctional phosphopantothenoylcysteine decarboxylase/phosphopantothenate--cysteine ligase CoaBC [Candidatus Marinimicrobia bacterium]|nr:bifunctional phosphopantothenoylcysteine decarboxylase/phosphopantothenate--cysteine ligase CoaBC [Candidatus Neomarinimicrobiota bacterium]|tara:strand:- start:646 stop:1851 length:1206 start_codon:yes stop_codon:yes gene_type:complete
MNNLKDKNILLCVTGSIAAYKACDLLRVLRKEGANVQVAMTQSALQFVGETSFSALSNYDVITQIFPSKEGETGLEHVNLAIELDAVIVAPATANILGKAANGVADDTVSTLLSICEQPTIFAPAMNFRMWQNKSTIDAVDALRKHGKIVINPEEGQLASLHEGEGRFPNTHTIINSLREVFDQHLPLKNKNILITAGPTREHIDPVRFISNRSSGKMGYSLAVQAKYLGANVTLISGPVHIDPVPDVNMINVESTLDMQRELNIYINREHNIDYIFMVAAVADYIIPNPQENKIKRKDSTLNIKFSKAPDLIQELSSKTDAKLIGFALETEDGEKNAKEKMSNKNLDYIVLNYANEPNAGFETNTNRVIIFSKKGSKKEFKLDRKDRIAAKLLDFIINNK